ncbi:hypothetical protein GE09DRAFT_283373 [Coniochaeta sp. 2T2.1]|nr:hypothetical protein GE09DRAFT_283373 [Coniochaeta sp. 2T2.1]
MRIQTLSSLVAGLASLAIGSPVSPPTNTAAKALWNGEEPSTNSVAAHLEGLPGCWAECFIKSQKYFHSDLNFFSFDDFCGRYWKAAVDWESRHVLRCAMHDCLATPCSEHNHGTCDLPSSVYQGTVTCP